MKLLTFFVKLSVKESFCVNPILPPSAPIGKRWHFVSSRRRISLLLVEALSSSKNFALYFLEREGRGGHLQLVPALITLSLGRGKRAGRKMMWTAGNGEKYIGVEIVAHLFYLRSRIGSNSFRQLQLPQTVWSERIFFN